jgi:hypothetical protein
VVGRAGEERGGDGESKGSKIQVYGHNGPAKTRGIVFGHSFGDADEDALTEPV